MSVKRGVGVSVGASRGRARVLSFFLKNTVLGLGLGLTLTWLLHSTMDITMIGASARV